HFFTMNEMSCFLDHGYGLGIAPPALKLEPGHLNQTRHHVLLAHGLAVNAIRANGKKGTKVGLAENISGCVPVIETPEHIQAAKAAIRDLNARYLTAILEGRYTDNFLQEAGKDSPQFTDAEMKIIGTPCDFIGINVYTAQGGYVRASDAPRGYTLVSFPE